MIRKIKSEGEKPEVEEVVRCGRVRFLERTLVA
jgi:hypothetical protein